MNYFYVVQDILNVLHATSDFWLFRYRHDDIRVGTLIYLKMKLIILV